MNNMETSPPKKRLAWPMLLLHIVAWGITLAVIMAVITANVLGDWTMREIPWAFIVEGEIVLVSYYGWPILCLEYRETSVNQPPETDFSIHPILLILNCVAGLFIVASTFFVFVFPLWRRKPFQVKMISLFILTTSVAFFFALYRVPFPIHPFVFIDVPDGYPNPPRFFYVYPLYLQIPLGLGIGCTIYMGLWLVLRLVPALVRILVKKRRFSFSLRTLMVFFTACCLFLGWWTNSAQRQKRVVAWVREQGGNVNYDGQYDDGGWPDRSKELEPNWLRDLLGIDYFHTVIEVEFSGTKLSDLSPLANLKSLRGLGLFDTQVSDFSPLADLKNIKFLWLNGTQVSDLSPLAELKNLEGLSLSGTQVSELSPLAKLKNLKRLHIRDTPVSEEEIKKLKKALPTLKVVRQSNRSPV